MAAVKQLPDPSHVHNLVELRVHYCRQCGKLYVLDVYTDIEGHTCPSPREILVALKME